MVAWDDRSKPTVNYGSLASGRGAGWPEKKTPQHVHRYTARPSLFLLRVSCPDLAWTIDGGKSSCIVSSKVNSERDAQKLGIIGYMTMADSTSFPQTSRHALVSSRPMAPRLDEPQTYGHILRALEALGCPPRLYERIVTKYVDSVDFSLRPAFQEQVISGWFPYSIVGLESCTLFCLPVPKSCLLVACKRCLQSSCRAHRGSLSVITTGVVPTTSHRFVRRGGISQCHAKWHCDANGHSHRV
ncbi:Uncharacterized protein HZ326_19681 [Fusarium oxysporum f. sp. albedinis]|nr:Uncharacterized protein HZ326_19681 [Fusarium oxysporum f. sp. albedinis]